MQGLHLLDQPSSAGEQRGLARDVLGLPPQGVAEQRGGLVVEVVAGRDDVEPPVEGSGVEDVALRQAADRAGGTRSLTSGGGDVEPVLVARSTTTQLGAALAAKASGPRASGPE